MGFSGGGSPLTRPHTHDSTIVNDGGSLQFDNVTQGSMSAGDLTYSDGNHLQVLNLGNVGEVLEAGASAPQWTPAGPTGAQTAQHILTSGSYSSTSTSFADTGLTFTIPTVAGSNNCLFIGNGSVAIGTLGNSVAFNIVDNVTQLIQITTEPAVQGYKFQWTVSAIGDASGNTGKVQMSISGGAATTMSGTAGSPAYFGAFAV